MYLQYFYESPLYVNNAKHYDDVILRVHIIEM
jgi:hypothetical protein